MDTKQLIAALEMWAPMVASGYEVPAAGQVMMEAARALKREIDVDDLANLIDELQSSFDGDTWFVVQELVKRLGFEITS